MLWAELVLLVVISISIFDMKPQSFYKLTARSDQLITTTSLILSVELLSTVDLLMEVKCF